MCDRVGKLCPTRVISCNQAISLIYRPWTVDSITYCFTCHHLLRRHRGQRRSASLPEGVYRVRCGQERSSVRILQAEVRKDLSLFLQCRTVLWRSQHVVAEQVVLVWQLLVVLTPLCLTESLSAAANLHSVILTLIFTLILTLSLIYDCY